MARLFTALTILAVLLAQPASAQNGSSAENCPKIVNCSADGCSSALECSGFTTEAVLEIALGQTPPIPSMAELDYEITALGFPQLTSSAIKASVASERPTYVGGGMVTGGRMSGSIWPNSNGGMIIGGPLDGTILPGSNGGMVVGGPYSGTIMPGRSGGMIIGGPLDGSILPSSNGGMIIGGPLNGTIVPPR